jgi:hypothetical protein
MLLRTLRILPLFGALVMALSATADPAPPAHKPKAAAKQEPEQPAAAQSPAPPPIQLPDPAARLLLIRSTLLALNHANITGNYSVFRELSAPSFQIANSVGRLSENFADLRHRRIDLSPLLSVTPQATEPARIMPNGLLYMRGFFPTTPERVNYELAYQLSQGRWQLFGIAVDTSSGPLQGAPPPPVTSDASPRAPEPSSSSSADAPKAEEPPSKTTWSADGKGKPDENKTEKK